METIVMDDQDMSEHEESMDCNETPMSYYRQESLLLEDRSEETQSSFTCRNPNELDVCVWHAIEEKDWDDLKALVGRCVSVKGKCTVSNGKTAAILAIEKGCSLETLHMLLQNGSSMLDIDDDGRSAVFWAVKAGQRDEMIKFLLEAGVSASGVDDDGMNIIMMALWCRMGEDVIFHLLQKAKMVEEPSRQGFSIVELALNGRYSERLIRYLVENGANVDGVDAKGKCTVMHALEKKLSEHLVMTMMERMESIESLDQESNTVLHLAVQNGYSERVLLHLLQNGASAVGIVKDGFSIVTYGIVNGFSEEILILLLKQGASLDDVFQGKKAMVCALEHGVYSETLISLLLDTGATLSGIGEQYGQYEVLVALSARCNEDVMHILFDKGASATGVDKKGRNTLMLGAACPNYSEHVVKRFVESGASLDVIDHDHMNMMMHAVCGRYETAVLRYLLDKGASFQGIDKLGRTVIMYALQCKRSKDDIELLLEYVGDTKTYLDTMDVFYMDAMMYAVKCDNGVDVISTLITNGAHIHNGVIMCAIMNTIEKSVEAYFHQRKGSCSIFLHTYGKLLFWLIRQSKDLYMKFSNVTLSDLVNITNTRGWTLLFEECCGDMRKPVLQCLLALGANIKVTDNRGFTPLMWLPCLWRHGVKWEGIIKWLASEAKKSQGLLKHEDFNFQNEYGVTALMVACFHRNNIASFSELCGVNKQDFYTGQSALHVVIATDVLREVFYNQEVVYREEFKDQPMSSDKKKIVTYQQKKLGLQDCIKILISNSTDMNIQDSEGKTPLYLACCVGDIEAAELLITCGANKQLTTYENDHPIAGACQYGQLEMLKWLVENHDISLSVKDINGNSLLHKAAVTARHDIISYLLAKNLNVNEVNKNGTTPLMMVCETPSVSERMIISSSEMLADETHVDPVRSNRLVSLTLLLGAGADPCIRDELQQSPLHKAAKYGRTSLIETLLETKWGGMYSSEPHCCDIHGNTALHLAIQHQHKDTAVVLITHMNDINIKNNLGLSPLHILCHLPIISTHTEDILDHLCKEGADPNSKDITQNTPIFTLCKKQNMRMAKALARRGAVITAITNCLNGNVLHELVMSQVTTMKHWSDEAGQHQHTRTSSVDELMDWLINEKKMHIDAQDLFGLTALHLACREGRTDFATLLIQYGADIHIVAKNEIVTLAFAALHPTTFKAVVEAYNNRQRIDDNHTTNNPLVKCKEDLEIILRISYYHNTFPHVYSVLASQVLPCTLSSIDLSALPKSIPLCNHTFRLPADWVSAHMTQNQDRVSFFKNLLAERHKRITYPQQRIINQFMSTFAHFVSEDHPAMAFVTKLSGSVLIDAKIIAADEYDIMCELKHVKALAEGKRGSEKVRLKVVKRLDGEVKCKRCAEIFNCDYIDREKLVAHFYEACSEAFTRAELWIISQPIYRLSSNDITGANRTISCLEIAIFDKDNPWLKATIDIVPAIHIIEVPKHCTIPKSIKNTGCRAVGKWFSEDPDNTSIFRLSFCLYDAEIFSKRLPMVLQKSYVLGKVMVHDTFCPILHNDLNLRASNLISSYLLKVCILQLYAHIAENRVIVSTPSSDRVRAIHIAADHADFHEEVMYWTSHLFSMLIDALHCKPRPFLELIYTRGFNVMGDNKFMEFKTIALKYATSLRDIVANSGKKANVMKRSLDRLQFGMKKVKMD